MQGDPGRNGTKGIMGVDGRSGVPGQKVGLFSFFLPLAPIFLLCRV